MEHAQGLVEWMKAPEGSMVMNAELEIYNDPITGLSIRSQADIRDWYWTLFWCPYEKSLSYLNALSLRPQFPSFDPFPSEFLNGLKQNDPHIIGHFFLIQQYLLGDKSYWWPYIRMLPQPQDARIATFPHFWPKRDLEFLAGTNVEPALSKRKRLWEEQWERGVKLLKRADYDWESYTLGLYEWAATIFDSRSFRSSLVLDQDTVSEAVIDETEHDMICGHLADDNFSVLLPLLDLCNHNGINNALNLCGGPHGSSILQYTAEIKAGDQIYNYYGDKSIAELLVAYGFILPTDDQRDLDRVLIQMNPPAEALLRRRIQRCHATPKLKRIENECIYSVSRVGARDEETPRDVQEPRPIQVNRRATNAIPRIPELRCFDHGLFELISNTLATERETRFVLQHPQYCLERHPELWKGPLSRNVFHVLLVLREKLQCEIDRIKECGANLGPPQNNNQATALIYRNNCLAVLECAIAPLQILITTSQNHSIFCSHLHNPTSNHHSQLQNEDRYFSLLSLECAYDWLRMFHSDIFTAAMDIISRDLEESLPLKWTVLFEDWDHTLWILWIMIVWLLKARYGDEDFLQRDLSLATWVDFMDSSYNRDPPGAFDGETSESEAVDSMIEKLSVAMPALFSPSLDLDIKALRNFASAIAGDEVVDMEYKMQDGPTKGHMVRQSVMCLCQKVEGLKDYESRVMREAGYFWRMGGLKRSSSRWTIRFINL